MMGNIAVFGETGLVSLRRKSGVLPFRIAGRKQSGKYVFESISLSRDDEDLVVVHAIATEPSTQNITDLCRDVILERMYLGPSSAISFANAACRKQLRDGGDPTDACVSAVAIKRAHRGARVAAVGSLLCYAIEDFSFRALALPQITSSGLLFNYLSSPHYQAVPEERLPWSDEVASSGFAIANRDISSCVSPEEIGPLFADANHPGTALDALEGLCRRRCPNCTPLMAIGEIEPIPRDR